MARRANQGLFDKLLSAGSRVPIGESLFMTLYQPGQLQNKGGIYRTLPGTVNSDRSGHHVNRELIVQKDGFLCTVFGNKTFHFFNRKLEQAS